MSNSFNTLGNGGTATAEGMRQQLEAVLESITDGFTIYDRDWRIIYLNTRAAEMVGLPKRDLLGNVIWELFPEAVGTAFHTAYHRAMVEQVPVQVEEYYAPFDSWYEVRAFPSEGTLTTYAQDITDRKRAEEQARSESELRRTIEQSTLAGIAIVDLEGRQTYVNPAFCRMVGWTEEELIGRTPPLPYWPPEEVEHISNLFRQVLAGNVTEEGYTMRQMRKNGERFDARLLVSSLANSKGERTGWLASFYDVSEHKRVEEALRQSETRYELAAEAGRVGVWDLNLENNELFLAPNLKALLGYRDDELTNHLDAWCQLVHPEDKEKAITATKAHLEGAVPKYEVEVRRRHKDGHYLWFLAQGFALRDETGRAYRLTGSDTDITARKRMEEELRQSEEKYRSLLENANDIIYSHDLEGNYLTINPAGASVTGYTCEEILDGMNIAQIVAPDHLERARQMMEQKLRDPSPTIYELDIIAKDGRRLTVEVSTRITFNAGRPVAVEGIARDVTERKRVEEERVRLQEEIIRAQENLLTELSTPLIPVKEGMVVMPLVGAMSTKRAEQMLAALLEGVRSRGAGVAILDITGVPTVDTQVANLLINAARAVRLMGSEVVITGVRARVAQTLIGLGVDLSGVVSLRNLQSGIEYAERLLGGPLFKLEAAKTGAQDSALRRSRS